MICRICDCNYCEDTRAPDTAWQSQPSLERFGAAYMLQADSYGHLMHQVDLRQGQGPLFLNLLVSDNTFSHFINYEYGVYART